MNPPPNPIRTLLLKGHRVSEVSRKLRVTESRIYQYAKLHSLPTNKTVLPGSRMEAQVLEAVYVLGKGPACALFKFAPPYLNRILSALEARVRKST